MQTALANQAPAMSGNRMMFLFALAALSIGAPAVGIDPLVARVFKILPLVLLIVTVGATLRTNRTHLGLWVMLGLVGSLVGDWVIEVAFVGGIAAFFVAHVLYLVAMGFDRQSPVGQGAAAVPAVTLWAGMYGLLAPRAPAELYVPVVAYLTVISLMFARASARAFVTRRDRASLVLWVGACFFVLSDSLIALNRWVVPIPMDRAAILATYYLGQALIAASAVMHARQASVSEPPTGSAV